MIHGGIMYFSTDDNKWMSKALTLAKKAWGRTTPNPMVGSVIVKEGIIIGQGYHKRAGEPHAEIIALREAGGDAKNATLYVTLEPCSSYGRTPPCVNAIIEAGISTVVVGVEDPNPKHRGKGIKKLLSAGIDVVTGIKEKECRLLNEHFFKWITMRKPFVILKMAMSLDGKIALVSGESKWITGSAARNRVQKLRQLADAILIGANTLRKDRPSLTVRNQKNWIQPKRIVASNSMTRNEAEKLFSDTGNNSSGIEIVRLNSPKDWDDFLTELGKEQIVTLLIEGGGELAASALNCNAVDKIEFHIAPFIMGGRNSKPVIAGENPLNLNEKIKLSNLHISKCGSDFIFTAYV